MRDLVLAKHDEKISNLLKNDILTVNENADMDDIFNLMSKYGLLALPVVDRQKKIIGVIRVNDIIRIMTPKRIKRQRILRTHKTNGNTKKKN
jgi:magnesium transporter